MISRATSSVLAFIYRKGELKVSSKDEFKVINLLP